MIVRGTVKDIVWGNAFLARRRLRSMGVVPSRLLNLSDPKSILRAVIQMKQGNVLSKDNGLEDELLFRTNHTLDELFADKRMFLIFSDQVGFALRAALDRRKQRLPPTHPSLGEINDLLQRLNFDKTGMNQEEQVWLSDRSIESMRGGGLAGDCTQPGAENYWTQGAWNATLKTLKYS